MLHFLLIYLLIELYIIGSLIFTDSNIIGRELIAKLNGRLQLAQARALLGEQFGWTCKALNEAI